MDKKLLKICQECEGRCCKRIPGICSPRDIKKLFPAQSLDKSVIQALKSGKFVIDYYEKYGEGGFEDYKQFPYIRPSTVNGRKIIDAGWGGICVFLKPDGCELGSKKPLECKLLLPKVFSYVDGKIEINCLTRFGKLLGTEISDFKINLSIFWGKHVDLFELVKNL